MQKIHFIHANGFPPKAYESLFNYLNLEIEVNNFLLLPSDYEPITIKGLKNWVTFQEEFVNTLDPSKKIIGMGHSIGGNIILRSALKNPEYFSKIIVLDPTLFIPRIIHMWRLTSMLGIQKKFHPRIQFLTIII